MDVIEIEGVSVRFPVRRVQSFKEFVVRGRQAHNAEPYVYGLRDISLVVRSGESIGIIGGNGAGKSTLLRVAAGIVVPSTGVVVSRGGIAPLIELGTGFESEMSGRENIYFNGALLGRTRAQIRSQLDEIIAFSGLEDSIDAPLRTYSTGMIARLAFSIATSVDAETILLDEILSVGDAAFREQCDRRIESFVRRGATMIIVSHDLVSIRKLCGRVLLLSNGRIAAYGPSAEVIPMYESESGKPPVSASR
jgi:ABC-type polysaccharide/polyol phosphate transport system ATPase subunit